MNYRKDDIKRCWIKRIGIVVMGLLLAGGVQTASATPTIYIISSVDDEPMLNTGSENLLNPDYPVDVDYSASIGTTKDIINISNTLQIPIDFNFGIYPHASGNYTDDFRWLDQLDSASVFDLIESNGISGIAPHMHPYWWDGDSWVIVEGAGYSSSQYSEFIDTNLPIYEQYLTSRGYTMSHGTTSGWRYGDYLTQDNYSKHGIDVTGDDGFSSDPGSQPSFGYNYYSSDGSTTVEGSKRFLRVQTILTNGFNNGTLKWNERGVNWNTVKSFADSRGYAIIRVGFHNFESEKPRLFINIIKDVQEQVGSDYIVRWIRPDDVAPARFKNETLYLKNGTNSSFFSAGILNDVTVEFINDTNITNEAANPSLEGYSGSTPTSFTTADSVAEGASTSTVSMSSNHYDGAVSFKVDKTNDVGWRRLSTVIPNITANQMYDFSMYSYYENTVYNPLELRVIWQNDALATIQTDNLYFNDTVSWNTWTKKEYIGKAPAGSTNATFHILIKNITVAYIDAIQIQNRSSGGFINGTNSTGTFNISIDGTSYTSTGIYNIGNFNYSNIPITVNSINGSGNIKVKINGTYSYIAPSANISKSGNNYLFNSSYASDFRIYSFNSSSNLITSNLSGKNVIKSYENYYLTNALPANDTGLTLQDLNAIITPSSDSVNATINTWNTTGDYLKVWTENSTVSTVTTAHTIGDFPANTRIQIKRDGVNYTTTTSNSTGYIIWTYSGGYSEHQFEAGIAEPIPVWNRNDTSTWELLSGLLKTLAILSIAVHIIGAIKGHVKAIDAVTGIAFSVFVLILVYTLVPIIASIIGQI